MKHLINELKLTYSPLANFAFTLLKTDPVIQEIMTDSNIYFICQRPEMRFDQIELDNQTGYLTFLIRQYQNDNILSCVLPLYQEQIAKDPSQTFELELGSYDPDKDFSERPVTNVDGIKVYRMIDHEREFLIWLTPEKFLYDWWVKSIVAYLEGDIRDFTRYQVHYIGKATEQEVISRLTGHEKLQDILSLQYPLRYGSLPTHELVILFFNFANNLQIEELGLDVTKEQLEASLSGKNVANAKTIYLDAEKAFVNVLQPKYNKTLFKNYPKSDDGLYRHDYACIVYSLVDPITLMLEKETLHGSPTEDGRDMIIIRNNETVEVIRRENEN